MSTHENDALKVADNAEQNTPETSPNPVQSLFQNTAQAASYEQSLGQGDGSVTPEDMQAYADEHGPLATAEAAVEEAREVGMQDNTNDDGLPVVGADAPVVNPHVVGTLDGRADLRDPSLVRDPSQLTFDELEKQNAAIQEEMRNKRETERAAVINRIKTDIARFGLKPSEIRLAKGERQAGTRKSSGPVKPKYRNPENPEQTWTGRGIAPKWIAGYAKEDRAQFEIKE